jgi:hypothetical protein
MRSDRGVARQLRQVRRPLGGSGRFEGAQISPLHAGRPVPIHDTRQLQLVYQK